jgi:rhamnose transport system ATP-binding protein
MAELVAEGLAVIMVSSELPEVMGMSDRIVVMRSGRMVDVLDNKNLTADHVVRLAIGVEGAAA